MWSPEVLEALHEKVETSSKSPEKIAAEIGISRPALLKIISGETGEPRDRTKEKIYDWLKYTPASGSVRERNNSELFRQSDTRAAGSEYLVGTEESGERLLGFLLGNEKHLETMVRAATAGLDRDDRRKIAHALFSGVKGMAINSGTTLPDWFFELERRFVAE